MNLSMTTCMMCGCILKTDGELCGKCRPKAVKLFAVVCSLGLILMILI